jgi:hypothetical protein
MSVLLQNNIIDNSLSFLYKKFKNNKYDIDNFLHCSIAVRKNLIELYSPFFSEDIIKAFKNLINYDETYKIQIPIFSHEIVNKILKSMKQINSDSIKSNMVIALPYDKYLLNQTITDSGIENIYTPYKYLFIFGIKNIMKGSETNLILDIECYTSYTVLKPWHRYNSYTTYNDFNEGVNCKLFMNIIDINTISIFTYSIYNPSEGCDQAGPSRSNYFENFNVYIVPDPTQYLT